MGAPAKPRPKPYPRPEAEIPAEIAEEPVLEGTDRRRFLGYLIAAPTLVVAAKLGADAIKTSPADAVIPSLPSPAALFDLGDLQDMAASPTSGLIKIAVGSDGIASFAMPRAEVGQGLTTAISMLIAEEIDLPVDKVQVTLADARPELIWNQLTGGSNSIRSLYTPVRIAAATARARLLATAAKQWGVSAASLTVSNGVIKSKTGKTTTYGAIAVAAAANKSATVSVSLKPASSFTVVGKSYNRVDAVAAVTGHKVYTMDLDIPNALPTMVCRPPSINGTVKSVANIAQVKAMPGITDVAIVSTGVAVRGATFGQCIDAVDALQVNWGPGSEDAQSDATVLAELKKAELPLVVPPLNGLAKTLDGEFTFYFRSNSPLETNCAIADVRPGSAEIWSSLKTPVVAQETIAQDLGLPTKAVTCHVVQGGGSFGRHLFFDAAREAAEISKKMGKPVKLMWHRTDDFRHGRTHPMCTSRIRVNYSGRNVLSYEQRHTSVSTDFTHGFGEIITEFAAELPFGNYTFAQTIFELTQDVPYNFGVTTQLLNEVDMGFHTGSMRNIYSPDVVTATELMVDQVANAMKIDPYVFRKQFLDNPRLKAVLDKAAQVGGWGKTMAPGTAQGIALHAEYKGASAALVEIDCRPETVNRKIKDGVGGPRVTKVVYVVDVGLPINPRGLEAQMLGGIMDGIAQTLTSSLHIKNGIPLEGSWDNYYYTRQWNVPLDIQVVVMPPTTGHPGGAGEFGVASTMAAVACAYARATGKMPTAFPINHNDPLGFVPLPLEPPLPEEPTDGLG